MWKQQKFHYRVYYSSVLVSVLCISSDVLLVCLSFRSCEQPLRVYAFAINAVCMYIYIGYALLHLLHFISTSNLMINKHRTVCCIHLPEGNFVLIYYLYWQNISVCLSRFSFFFIYCHQFSSLY